MPNSHAKPANQRHGSVACVNRIPALSLENDVPRETKTVAEFGVIFSRQGPYATVATAMFNGALLATEEMNARPGATVELRPLTAEPAGRPERYAAECNTLLERGIRHVVGCYTSSSRKECIPLFEKADALLWYPSHYEGFETSDNVIYTGAVANQHLLPLTDYMRREFGSTAFCVGSNYIWSWENNRVIRERLGAIRGRILGERYFAVGETDFACVIDAIVAARPSFVFNTLIGVSAYRFMSDFRAACRSRGIDQTREFPIASCTLSEPELAEIGADAADGHITVSVYFSSIVSQTNARFVTAYDARFPGGPAVCADAESAYIAVKFLALALEAVGPDAAVQDVKAAAAAITLAAPQGAVTIDPTTFHASLTPRIARSTAGLQFEILAEAPGTVAADPYLVWNSPRFWTTGPQSTLRIAS